MAISSNCLFHFTSKLEYLEDIIRNGFWPRYCREYGWGNQYIDFILPMVCFCDIPLSMISEHTRFYGQFGLGVSPKWIQSHKDITPVQYISVTSYEFNSVNKLLTKLKNNTITEAELSKLKLVKKVSGMAINKNGTKAKKKFYDEREWRYVPSGLQLKDLIIPVEKQCEFNLSTLSAKTKNLGLSLDMSEIKYLIIPNESYRYGLISRINEIYKEESKDKKDILISRIISVKQIEEDF